MPATTREAAAVRSAVRVGTPVTGPVDGSVYTLAVRDVFAALSSSPRGLTAAEVLARRQRVGPNELPRQRPRRPWRRFLAQFTDLFAVVLLVAAAVTFLAYRLQDPHDVGRLQLAVAILAVVVLNAMIGFAQEYSAERTAQALQEMVPHSCRVLRDSYRAEVPVRDLVPGDVVVLDAGDAVPADGRLVEAREFTLNAAALTGESEPVRRSADPASGSTALVQTSNAVLMGTTVTAGAGKAVVVNTGDRTEFGRICRLTAEAPQARSPLQRQVAVMARWVSLIALAIGAAMFLLRLPAGQPILAAFVFALGVMVALVPEGLPATMSVSLAIGVRRMARRHALVRRLLAVEALGSTTVICTDKTGTLTKAEMTVTRIWAAGVPHAVSGVGYAPVGTVDRAESVRRLLLAAALCSNARLVPPAGDEGWRVLGDTTEGALLVAATKAGLDIGAAAADAPRVSEFPFDPTRKVMSTVHRTGTGYVCHVKGAPHEILRRCAAVEWNGAVRVLQSELSTAIAEAGDVMAAEGLRVLAVATRDVPGPYPAQQLAESGLTLLGLVGMVDPPRVEVAGAVRACQRAGIRIVMVSGDHPLTVEAVARRVGIVQGAAAVTVTGAELDNATDAELDELVSGPDQLLFSRVSPEHKMRVVTALQRRGDVVAVTGDGANDAPALKHADIGVAMGASGTDVAREAAVMVLLDDSFASVAAAVEVGRSVYHNVRKFLVYVFVSNVGELAPILVATFTGFPLVPLQAVQILAIDLGSDVLPALALGAEPPEPDVMDRPPRSPRQRLMSAPVAGRILFLGGIQALGVCTLFFWHVNAAGIPWSAFTTDEPAYRSAVTAAQAAIVVSQVFVSLAVRTDRQSLFRIRVLSNPRLIAAGAVGLAFMAAVSYAPPLQAVFGTAPLHAGDWAVAAGFGVVLLAAEEARKWWLRRREAARAAGPGKVATT